MQLLTLQKYKVSGSWTPNARPLLLSIEEEEEEGFYNILPANTADHLYNVPIMALCSNHHEIWTVYYVVENPHMIRLCEK